MTRSDRLDMFPYKNDTRPPNAEFPENLHVKERRSASDELDLEVKLRSHADE